MSGTSQRKVIVAATAGLAILASVAWYSLSGPVARTTNVTPGDIDYPQVNRNPRHTIAVTLLAPTSLDLQLSALYIATLGRDKQTTSVVCHFASGTHSDTAPPNAWTEYSVEIPVAVSFQGAVENPRSIGEASYRATVAVDKFAAGRCHWRLDRVLYRVIGAETSSNLFQSDEEHPGYGMAENGMLSMFWCKSVTAKNTANAHELCIGHRADPPGASGSDPRVFPLRLGSEDTQVQIEFLDQDHLVAPGMIWP